MVHALKLFKFCLTDELAHTQTVEGFNEQTVLTINRRYFVVVPSQILLMASVQETLEKSS